MRISLLKFLLPLLLLLTQQGVITHELGHLGGVLGNNRQHENHKQLPGSLSCEKCLSFANLTGGLTSQESPPPVLHLTYDHAAPPAKAELAADLLVPRSRGPPTFP